MRTIKIYFLRAEGKSTDGIIDHFIEWYGMMTAVMPERKVKS
jgi:cytochrome c-type biogenesis protein CcmH/NrfF